MSTNEPADEDEMIIVSVRRHGEWSWFKSIREYWVLDWIAWEDMFEKAGVDAARGDYSARFGIPVVDAGTGEQFLDFMTPFRKSREELHREFWDSEVEAQTWFDVSDHMPILLVDFDARELRSVYSEMMRFERFVPDAWVGVHGEFYDRIPETERYWFKNGQDGAARFYGVAEASEV